MGPKRFGLFVSIVVVIQIVIDDDQVLQTPSIIFSIGSANMRDERVAIERSLQRINAAKLGESTHKRQANANIWALRN